MRKIGLVLATLAALSFTMVPVTTQSARADAGVVVVAIVILSAAHCIVHPGHGWLCPEKPRKKKKRR